MCIVLFSSCLKMDLEEIEAFEDAEVTDFNFEYRWMGDNNGNDRLFVMKMKTSTEINAINNTVTCMIEVPAAKDEFTAEEREKVSLQLLVGYADISNAATLEPVGNAPELGKVQDFSSNDIKYKVIAADDKTTREWTLIIADFVK